MLQVSVILELKIIDFMLIVIQASFKKLLSLGKVFFTSFCLRQHLGCALGVWATKMSIYTQSLLSPPLHGHQLKIILFVC